MRIGVIADDFTGGSDVALVLARAGLPVVLINGLPRTGAIPKGAGAVVLALKSRTCSVGEAVAQSLSACAALQAAGAERILFKYCSTFDSTDEGNIGPVADALLEQLGAEQAIVCPAYPENGRSLYAGHLFVDGQLLSDTPMKDHPLTPMREPDLVKVLARQCRATVGLIPWDQVSQGPEAIARALAKAQSRGEQLLVTDAIRPADLGALGNAVVRHRLVTGGAGIAQGLAEALVGAGQPARMVPPPFLAGRSAILSGSCSARTRQQLEQARAAGLPLRQVDPLLLNRGEDDARRISDWALAQPPDQPVVIWSSDDPTSLSTIQDELGQSHAATLVETAMAETAMRLVAEGFDKLLVAGGETSGAVVIALGHTAFDIGPEAAPGVPWLLALGERPLALLLKSGNFGAPDLFLTAWDEVRATDVR
jgi:uncharacterized protein YgbK (DUF1537 family)